MADEFDVNVSGEEKEENQVVVTSGSAVVASTHIDLPDLGKLFEGTEGIITGDIGLKVSRVPIEKYKASTQKIDLISFITSKVMAIKMHYIEGTGGILCFGKKCCEIKGMPSVRYLFPIIVYQTDNEGNLVGKKLDLKILSAGEDLYKSIITINKATAAMGGIDNVDLLVTCTDDKYQKITLNQAGPAKWKKSASARQFVIDKWTADAEYAYMAVARKVDEDAFLQLIGVETGGGDGSIDAQTRINPANTDLSKFFDD